MKDTHVTSHNQSGGITAGAVHTTRERRLRKGWKWVERWQWIVGIAAGIAAILTVWWAYPGQTKMKEPSQSSNQQGSTNVTSFNQSGGITAHTVNVGPNPRHLNDLLRKQLDEQTVGKAKINVVSVMGDGEAYDFATEITNYLKSKGLPVDGVSQAVFSGPVKGQGIKPLGNDGVEIVIGNRE